MGLEEDTRIYGAKGAALKYIAENEPSTPIEPFVLVRTDETWKEHQTDIERLGECLVRSSSPIEDGKRLSFAGLFLTSRLFAGEAEEGVERIVKDVLGSVNDPLARTYARIHGVKIPKKMGLVFHKHADAKWNWGMLRHPHQQHILFIQGRPLWNHYLSENFVFDTRKKEFYDVGNYSESVVYGHKLEKENDVAPEIHQAIETYERIEKLPAFQTGHTYHMEFGTEPFSVYQFRPFREIAKTTWKIHPKAIRRRRDVHSKIAAISFGVTPKEGLDLIPYRGFAVEHHGLESEYAKEQIGDLKGKSEEEIRAALREYWDLSEVEEPYLDATMERWRNNGRLEATGYAFGRAIERMNAQAKKDESCFLLESMHFNTCQNPDIVFPNAKAFLGDMGIEFLSHNWFRAAQSYDIAMLGGLNLYQRTEERVKIISNGEIGVLLSRVEAEDFIDDI